MVRLHSRILNRSTLFGPFIVYTYGWPPWLVLAAGELPTRTGTRILLPGAALGGHVTKNSCPCALILNCCPARIPWGTVTSNNCVPDLGFGDRDRDCSLLALELWLFWLELLLEPPVGREIWILCPGSAFWGQLTRNVCPLTLTWNGIPVYTLGGTVT